MAQHYDVLIVGAGPAGTACALALRNSGLSVAMLDKHIFPRNKTCGDAIPGHTYKFLNKILPEAEHEFEVFELKQKIQSSVIYLDNHRSITINWKGKAYNSSRTSFDNFLFGLVKKYSSTLVFEDYPILSIEKKDDLICLCTKDDKQNLSAKIVIGCDGANSIIAKNLAPDLFKQSKGLALRGYYKNVDSPKLVNEFYTLKKFKGYFWIFPVENDIYNVGIGIPGDLNDKGFDLKLAFNEAIKSHSIIHEKMKNAVEVSRLVGFKLPMGGIKSPISGDRFILAGDAAFLIDPLLGHGIDKAILSGGIAAKHILQCFKNNNFSAKQIASYDDEIYTKLLKELKRNHKIVQILSIAPWLLRLIYYASKLNLELLLKMAYSKMKSKSKLK